MNRTYARMNGPIVVAPGVMKFERAMGLVLSLMGLLLLAYLPYASLRPEIFQSMVRMKLDPEEYKPDLDVRNMGFGYWLISEFERIQSKSILYPVITDLNLNKKWAERLKRQQDLDTPETYLLLKKHVDVRQDRGTNLIEITVRSEDREEAAIIANAIAVEYRMQKLAMRQRENSAYIAALTNALHQIEQQIRDWEDKTNQSASSTKEIQQELENLRKTSDHVKMRILEAKVEPCGHYHGIAIIDLAEPASTPIFPNKLTMSGAVLFGSLSLLAGLLFVKRRSKA